MAFITCQFYSDLLLQRMQVDLLLPLDSPKEKGRATKGVLFLLHGQGGNQSDWQQYSAVPRYAVDNQLAVVYVSCPQSFYADMKYGGAFYTYMTEELPAFLKKAFHLPLKRETTYIAGLSMGGYGAAMLALSRPDLYGACGAFSGPLEIEQLASHRGQNDYARRILAPVFGEKEPIPPAYSVEKLARKTAKLPLAQRPRMFIACGKQDPLFDLYEENVRMAALLEKLGYDLKYMEWDGIHEFDFWDRAIVYAIAFFRKNRYAEKILKDWK